MAQNKWSDQAINDFAKTAWVAACEINPTNPFAVAQNIKGMYNKLQKISRWMDMLIKDAKAQLKTSGNFTTLMEALEHDIKNYEATKADITSVLTAIEMQE